jgi:hypothetical protein
MRYAVALVLLLDLALTWNLPAHARAQTDLPYAVGEAFSTAVRFVRVDRGCKVTDKDAEAAFVAFECDDAGKIRRGSFELFRVTGQGPSREMVRTQVTLGDETHGMELRWLELFERKLREERGTPSPPPPTAAATPKRDGGV